MRSMTVFQDRARSTTAAAPSTLTLPVHTTHTHLLRLERRAVRSREVGPARRQLGGRRRPRFEVFERAAVARDAAREREQQRGRRRADERAPEAEDGAALVHDHGALVERVVGRYGERELVEVDALCF